MIREFRNILQEEEDERFVKRWLCFWFFEPTRSNQKEKREESKKTEIKKVQYKLHQKLQKEFKKKTSTTPLWWA